MQNQFGKLREELGDRITGGRLTAAVMGVKALQQEVGQMANNEEIMREAITSLELALEDSNWMRLIAEGEREFTREGLRRIAAMARVMFLKNPLIKREVMVKALYVWGQGISVRVKDPTINQVLQNFWDDPYNQAELTGHAGRMYKEIDLQVEGNIFFVFFMRPDTGQMRVRSLPPDEVGEIISDPEDQKTPWYYVRRWNEKKLNLQTGRINTTRMTRYYPDWRYKPVQKPAKIQGFEVDWDTPIYHVRTGGLAEWKFGLSEVYTSLDWAKAYKDFLEDVASLMRSYSRFAYKLTLKNGTSKGVQATKSKLNSTYGTEGVMGETNPSPVVGSTFIGSDQYDLQPMNLRGASISPEDGRRLLLMVASSAGLPETFFGDIKGGTLATGKTLDRPTELMMRNRQMFWADIFRNIFQYVVRSAVSCSDGPLAQLGIVKTSAYNGLISEELIWNKGINARMEIEFPPVLERDVQTSVQAIVAAATLNGQQIQLFDEETVARLLLTALAQENADELMNDIYPNATPSVGQVDAGSAVPEDQPGAAQKDQSQASQEMVRRAVRELSEALGVKEGWGYVTTH